MSKQIDNATASENTSTKLPTRRQFAIARKITTTRPANQHRFRLGTHSPASLPLFSFLFS